MSHSADIVEKYRKLGQIYCVREAGADEESPPRQHITDERYQLKWKNEILYSQSIPGDEFNELTWIS